MGAEGQCAWKLLIKPRNVAGQTLTERSGHLYRVLLTTAFCRPFFTFPLWFSTYGFPLVLFSLSPLMVFHLSPFRVYNLRFSTCPLFALPPPAPKMASKLIPNRLKIGSNVVDGVYAHSLISNTLYPVLKDFGVEWPP